MFLNFAIFFFFGFSTKCKLKMHLQKNFRITYIILFLLLPLGLIYLQIENYDAFTAVSWFVLRIRFFQFFFIDNENCLEKIIDI